LKIEERSNDITEGLSFDSDWTVYCQIPAGTPDVGRR